METTATQMHSKNMLLLYYRKPHTYKERKERSNG